MSLYYFGHIVIDPTTMDNHNAMEVLSSTCYTNYLETHTTDLKDFDLRFFFVLHLEQALEKIVEYNIWYKNK